MAGPSPKKTEATRPLPVRDLRWRCRPKDVPFASTANVAPVEGIVGQSAAVDALRFGLNTVAPGQHVFVRGISGTGRFSLIRRLIEQIQPLRESTNDLCFVHNFAQPDQPRLVTLPARKGVAFRRAMQRLAEFIEKEMRDSLYTDLVKQRRARITRKTDAELAKYVDPFRRDLESAGLALVDVDMQGHTMRTVVPTFEGQAVPFEQLQAMHAEGKLPKAELQRVEKELENFAERLMQVQRRARSLARKQDDSLAKIMEQAIRDAVRESVESIAETFPTPSAREYLDDVVEDLATHRLDSLEEAESFTHLYRVNVLLDHVAAPCCPVIVESTPTTRQLRGGIDYDFDEGDEPRVSHMGIRAGSILRADGGYLILHAYDVLNEPGAWRALTRTLRTGKLEITPSDSSGPWTGPTLNPQPIPIQVKVVLLGDHQTYALLDQADPDFGDLFKVLADFDTTLPRNADAVEQYGGVLSRIAMDDNLLPFNRSAVAALVEHGARIAAQRDKLTARFGRLADIAREAAFLAQEEQGRRVEGTHVKRAVARGRARASLPSRRYHEMVQDGTIQLQTQGLAVGQINGLAVLRAGPLTYGFPARITATVGAGTAGLVNVDREARLSGAIHTKGFFILSGLLRHLLQSDHPLTFDASIGMEQSYGGIDGDSASGAEMCCLLSALTGVPLAQTFAMTGAIDQHGNIMAIGGANEKIEGFFDICQGRNGESGHAVIIPAANVGDLMLREDVVLACKEKRFAVYAVSKIHQALALLTGVPAGQRSKAGQYPEGTLLRMAADRAVDYWERARPEGHAR